MTITGPQTSGSSAAKNENKEKVKKMKEIKKYFDSIFEEIKEVNKEIMNKNKDLSDGVLPQKSKQTKDKEAELLKKAIERAYNQIRLNSK